jgi:hypothetical protein
MVGPAAVVGEGFGVDGFGFGVVGGCVGGFVVLG